MRQFTLSLAAGIALAALLSAAPAMAQAYNTEVAAVSYVRISPNTENTGGTL